MTVVSPTSWLGVDSPMALERLLYVLAAQVGGVLSPSKVAAELSLDAPSR